MGAWIEMEATLYKYKAQLVAPLVGAWIEMYGFQCRGGPMPSLHLWERGLKY